MRLALRKLFVLLEVWFAYLSAYRIESVIWMLTGTLPLIMLGVWIGKAQASGGAVRGFTPQDFTAYFLAAWMTQELIFAWVTTDLDTQIRQGDLSSKLLRPFDVFWEHLAGHVAERLVQLPFMALAILGGLALVPGARLTPDFLHALAYGVAVLQAFVMRFLIAYCIGLLAFWFEQATAIDELYFIVAAFLTGGFAPLDLYPEAVRNLIAWLPFPYMIYQPVRILNGLATPAEIGQIFAVQLVWIVVLAGLRLLLWRQGLRRYGAFGA
ncbi:MAG TPA: ABC-2 family transporter protein [Roseiflexaceae bacterium]|nr:ABC-2 family transporter protein [Roseiflexaceae bacterium]